MDNVLSSSYYCILQVDKNADVDDIKKSYQNLILKYHPDKQAGNAEDDSTNKDLFHQIDAAWKVLRDKGSRKKYDAELTQRSYNDEPIVYETLTKNDFSFNETEDCYYYSCRCGGTYLLPDELLEKSNESCYLSCDECSLVIEYSSR